MNLRIQLFSCFAAACVSLSGIALAQESTGTKAEPKKTESKEKDPNAKPEIPDNAAVDAVVWGAVVYASNEDDKAKKPDAKTQKELPDLEKRLGKIKQFKSYKRFDVIGQHTQKIFSEYTNWVVPSKELFLNVDSKGPAKEGAKQAGMNLHVQLWRRTKVLVKTDTTLKKGSPLVIGGPKWREGRLIFVLLLK